jgi:hypothetical protein
MQRLNCPPWLCMAVIAGEWWVVEDAIPVKGPSSDHAVQSTGNINNLEDVLPG